MLSYIAIGFICGVLGFKLGHAVRDDEAKKCDCAKEKLEQAIKVAKRDAYTQAKLDLRKEKK